MTGQIGNKTKPEIHIKLTECYNNVSRSSMFIVSLYLK